MRECSVCLHLIELLGRCRCSHGHALRSKLAQLFRLRTCSVNALVLRLWSARAWGMLHHDDAPPSDPRGGCFLSVAETGLRLCSRGHVRLCCHPVSSVCYTVVRTCSRIITEQVARHIYSSVQAGTPEVLQTSAAAPELRR